MHVLEAHASFASLPNDDLVGLLPDDLEIVGGGVSQLETVTLLPLYLTAAASLSGQLDDCRTVNDLRDACLHFKALWNSEILGPEQLGPEAAVVFQTIGDACIAARQLEHDHDLTPSLN